MTDYELNGPWITPSPWHIERRRQRIWRILSILCLAAIIIGAMFGLSHV